MAQKNIQDKIKVGSVVAFNFLEDAIWFDVIIVEGPTLAIREHGTNYVIQTMDKSLVKQVRE